jgi:acetyltransferase-like isoleucine patch superfamily enzyme
MILWRFVIATAFYLYNGFVVHVPSYTVRHLYLRLVLKIHIGRHSAVHMGCFFSGNKVRIGSHTVLNRDCHIDGREGVTIGDCVSVSPEVYILSMTHDAQSGGFAEVRARTVVGDHVWIGVRAIILPGVKLGEGCVVGAGSVVTRDVAPFDIVAGVPAKVVGTRNRELTYKPRYRPFYNGDV